MKHLLISGIMTILSTIVLANAQVPQSAVKYYIYYNANGGSGSMERSIRYYGDKKALSANQFKRTGYHFSKWNTKADGNGSSYNNKTTKNLTKTNGKKITLYAQWERNNYTIRFKGNNATSGSMQSLKNRKYGSLINCLLWHFSARAICSADGTLPQTAAERHTPTVQLSKT